MVVILKEKKNKTSYYDHRRFDELVNIEIKNNKIMRTVNALSFIANII